MNKKKAIPKPMPPISSYHEFLEISLTLDGCVEDMAKKIGRRYDELHEYLKDSGLLEKYKRRSFTLKSDKKRKRYTIANKDPVDNKWPTKCTMYISYNSSYGTPMSRKYYASRVQ